MTGLLRRSAPRAVSPGPLGTGARSLSWFSCLSPLCAAIALWLGAASGYAQTPATLTVTNTNDSGAGSLRAAVAQANTDNIGDTINFSVTGTITLTSGPLSISGEMTIEGPATGAGVTIDGGQGAGGGATASSVFIIANEVEVNLSNLTITHGSAANGGGIDNEEGDLELMNCTISANTSSDMGGGIYNEGFISLTNSTISGNSAANKGGGIYSDLYGQLSISNTTISANSAPDGSGMDIAGNGDSIVLVDSIVAGNLPLTGSGTTTDIDGTYSDESDNDTDESGNVVNLGAIQLAPLGNYGGPTQTMPPLAGSPALNAGILESDEPTTDQRGAPRPSTIRSKIDSGAVEISGEPPLILSVSPSAGPAAGGTSVLITGTGLDAATAVSFGSTPAASFTVNAGTTTALASVTAASPAASSGAMVDITVANASGTSPKGAADQFTYLPAIVISPSGSTLNAAFGASFSQTFTVSGGSGSYQLSTGGAPPAGLTLTPSPSGSGWTLSGTPSTAGGASLSLTVTDRVSTATTTESYTVAVARATPAFTVGQSTVGDGSGGTISITFMAASAGVSPPTGTVTYAVDGGTSAQAAITGGVATLLVPSTLGVGSHTFQWTYGGDGNYAPLPAQSITQSITTSTAVAAVTAAESTVTAGQQSTVTLTVNPYPETITATATLGFTPAPPNTVQDPAVLFSNNAATQTVTIDPGTAASSSQFHFQAGSTAGTITVTIHLTLADGQDVTPADLEPVTVSVPAAPPVISSATLTRSGQSFEVLVLALSATREMSQAQFHLTPVPGKTLNTTDVTVPLGTVFQSWYGSTDSEQYGTNFMYTQPFTLDGDAADIQSVSVILLNSAGSSDAATAQ